MKNIYKTNNYDIYKKWRFTPSFQSLISEGYIF